MHERTAPLKSTLRRIPSRLRATPSIRLAPLRASRARGCGTQLSSRRLCSYKKPRGYHYLPEVPYRTLLADIL